MIADGFKVTVTTQPLPDIAVSAAIALAFDDDGRLLIIKNQRGWDLPGGHLEAGEAPEGALHREVMEEARAIIGRPQLFMAASRERSMLFYKATVISLLPFKAAYETTERAMVDAESFLKMYQGGAPDLVRLVIAAALQVT